MFEHFYDIDLVDYLFIVLLVTTYNLFLAFVKLILLLSLKILLRLLERRSRIVFLLLIFFLLLHPCFVFLQYSHLYNLLLISTRTWYNKASAIMNKERPYYTNNKPWPTFPNTWFDSISNSWCIISKEESINTEYTRRVEYYNEKNAAHERNRGEKSAHEHWSENNIDTILNF